MVRKLRWKRSFLLCYSWYIFSGESTVKVMNLWPPRHPRRHPPPPPTPGYSPEPGPGKTKGSPPTLSSIVVAAPINPSNPSSASA